MFKFIALALAGFALTGCGDSAEEQQKRLTFTKTNLKYELVGEVDGCKLYVYNIGGSVQFYPGTFTTCPNALQQTLGAVRGAFNGGK